jgi:hypothetical protein
VATAFTVFATVFPFALVLDGRAFGGVAFFATALAGNLDFATGFVTGLALTFDLTDFATGLAFTFDLTDFAETFFKAFGAALGEGFETFFLAGDGIFFAISVTQICDRVMGRETWGKGLLSV